MLISIENWYDLETDKKHIVLRASLDRTASEIGKELRTVLKEKAVSLKVSSSFKSAQRPSLTSQSFADDRTELDFYIFHTQAKCMLLAFTRVLPSDYPLRLLTGNKQPCYLVYVSLAQIETFLVNSGWISKILPEHNAVA